MEDNASNTRLQLMIFLDSLKPELSSTYRPITTTDDYKSEEFIVRYYPEGKSSYTQFEDNGKDNLTLRINPTNLFTYSAIHRRINTG